MLVLRARWSPHAKTDTSFKLKLHGLVMIITKLLSNLLSLLLNGLSSNVFHLFLDKNRLQNSVATIFIEVKYLVGYDSIDSLWWQVIKHLPVRTSVLELILHSL